MHPNISVSVLSRPSGEFERARSGDAQRIYRNADPKMHPFARGREYVRALNAAKMDRIFAKPFVFALDGHRDGVYSLSMFNNSLIKCASAAGDGELKVWNLSTRKELWGVNAHQGMIRGISTSKTGDFVVSAGQDCAIKVWKQDYAKEIRNGEAIQAVSSFLGPNAFSAVDCHSGDDSLFVTSGARVDLWDINRSAPLHSFEWGVESINTIRFNKVEHNLLVSTASDRSVVIYDVRSRTPVRKIILNMQCNAICWNPMVAYHFTVASEDNNLYSFDTRSLDHAICIHEDHLGAVMAVDYSPTGKEIVSGSYDKTVRIFKADGGHSHQIYHTKRMQRIFGVKFTLDDKYALSGSDDCNVRLWKHHAGEKIGTLLPREQQAINYRQKLKEKFEHAPEVRKIAKHKHLPKVLYNMKQTKHERKLAENAKEERVRKHTKPEKIQYKPEKQKSVRKEVE